jgi:hypothetical protein
MKLADLIRLERQKTPTPGPAAIRAALVGQGHSVTVSYIKLVLWRDRNPKKKAKKIKPWQKHWPVSVDSRSEAIRKLLAENLDMTTAAIQAKLDEPVSANLIKVVRHKFKKKQEAKARMRAREEDQRRMGLADLPVGGKLMNTQTELEAEAEELLNRLTEELAD